MSDTRVFDAIEFATRAHAGQYRKATRLPYIFHPLSVARILIECDVSDDLVVAALLHDVVEDTTVTLDEIRVRFGSKIADWVAALSEPDRTAPWERRKRDNLIVLETVPQEVVLIELADKLDNLRDIAQNVKTQGAGVWQRFNRGRDQQKWYYGALAEIFIRRAETDCAKALAHELHEHVQTIFAE